MDHTIALLQCETPFAEKAREARHKFDQPWSLILRDLIVFPCIVHDAPIGRINAVAATYCPATFDLWSSTLAIATDWSVRAAIEMSGNN
jgi:hypothetical protein